MLQQPCNGWRLHEELPHQAQTVGIHIHKLPPAATNCNQLTSAGLLPYPKDRAQGLRFPSSPEVCTNGLRHNSTYGTYRAEWPEAWAQPTRCFQEVPPSAPQR